MIEEDLTRRNHTFFRIVRGHTPTIHDFYSHRASRPRSVPPTGISERSWRGVSVYAELEEAISNARQKPALGTHIARLEIPARARVRMQHTPQPNGASHWDLEARPSKLLRLVREVIRVWPRRHDSNRGVE